MPFKMVLWCNGSTRDFGSLRDCSSRSRTTFWGKYIFYLFIVLLLVKVVVQKLLNLHLFGACFYLVLTFISQLLAQVVEFCP